MPGFLDIPGLDPQTSQFVRNQGLLGLGAGLLSSSGPSTTPVSVGQALGHGLLGMNQFQSGALKNAMALKKSQADATKAEQGADLPSAVREWQFLKQEFPNMPLDFPTYLNVKRQGFQITDLGGVPSLASRVPGVPSTPLSSLQKEAQGKTALSQAQKIGQETGEKIANRPEAELRVQTINDNMGRLQSALTELRDDQGLTRITGPAFGRLPNVTGTATGAQAQLNSIRSQIFVTALQSMREASKTGGAVGNVSEREGDKLENTLAALDQAQTTEDFKRQLNKAIDQTKLSIERINKAFRDAYGTDAVQPEKKIRRFNIETGKIE